MTTLAAPYMMKNSPIQKAYGNALGVKTGFSGITSSPFKILPIFAVIGAALKAGGAAIGGAIAKGGIAIAKGAMTVGAKLGIKGAAAAATKLGAAAGKVSAWSAGAAKGLGTALGKAGMGSKLYAGIHAKALAAAKGAGGVTTAAGKAAFGKSMAVGLKGFTGKGILKSALGGSKLAGVVANQAPGIVAGQAISSLMSKGPQAQQPSGSTDADVNYSVKSPKDATTSMWHS